MINHLSYCISLTLLCSSLSAATDTAPNERTGSPFNTVGARIGFDHHTKVSLKSYELYGRSDPQWSYDLSEKTSAAIGYQAAAGALTGEGEVAAYIHFGFTLKLAHEDLPVALLVAYGPSLYSDDTFGDFDMGGHIQFTSSIGLGWTIREDWMIEYRLQHTSNAGLKEVNPGLDMHAFALSHSF